MGFLNFEIKEDFFPKVFAAILLDGFLCQFFIPKIYIDLRYILKDIATISHTYFKKVTKLHISLLKPATKQDQQLYLICILGKTRLRALIKPCDVGVKG